MASEELSPFDVYRGLRKARAGTQLENVFRALCYALHEWCAYSSSGSSATPAVLRRPRHEDDGAPDNGRLLLIEFDKFVNIICRLWGEMFRATGLQRLDTIEELTRDDLNKIVRFRPPAEELPGKHGPGEARRKPETDTVVYLSDMVESLAEEGFPYFTFELREQVSPLNQKEPRDGAKRRRKNDDPHKWVVKPGLAVGDDTTFWGSSYTRAEIEFFRKTAAALKHLGPTEIRALGTHKSQPGTMEEIRRELKWARKICAKLVLALEGGRLNISDASRLRDFTDEATRKAVLNEDYYASAYDTMLRELGDGQLKDAFEDAQKDASVVWGHGDIEDICKKAERAGGVADYVYAVAFFSEHPVELSSRGRTRAAAAAVHSFEDGFKSLRKHGVTGIPESLTGVFEGNAGVIKSSVTKRLSALLKDI